jgi:nicotinic acid phosphoribosyltransferase
MKPVGTMAHEFIQAGQAVGTVTLADSQRYMLQARVDEYRGDRMG